MAKLCEAVHHAHRRGIDVMYRKGLGRLPKDDAQAVNWYRKAAEAVMRMLKGRYGVYSWSGHQ